MRIDFVTRSDSPDKFGGDTLQMYEYWRRLEVAGVSVKEVPYSPRMSLRTGAIVHIMNVDRPYDFLDAVNQARGHTVVVSPIHHSLSAVRQMRRSERGKSARSLVGRALPESARELLAYAARTWLQSREQGAGVILRGIARAVSSAPGVWSRVGRELNRANAVALLAEGEGTHLKIDTGWGGSNAVLIPNGLPLDVAKDEVSRPWNERTIQLLVVGRIEPRKRQAELAEAAGAMRVPIVFAGALNANTGTYGDRFRRALHPKLGIEWRGRLSHAATIALMGNARVLINSSWVEVQSLVDLEAAHMGCHVVCAAAGNSREWLGEAVHVVEGDPRNFLEAGRRLVQGNEGPKPSAYSWSWDDATRALLSVYGDLEGLGEDEHGND